MHRNQHTIEIDRPASAVFPFLAASERRLRWMGMLAESVQLTPGEPGVGTRFRDVFVEGGRRFEIDAEIAEYEPDERVATRIRTSGFEGVSTQELTESDGRTRLKTTIETNYTSRVARLMAGVVTRHAQRQLEKDLATLKRLVESEAEGPST